MMPVPGKGHCLCKAVRYSFDEAPRWQAHCHCESCRRATASPFTSYFGIADGHWKWTGAAPAIYASSPGVTRFFCSNCGTPMGYRADSYPGEMHLFAATLDDPNRFVPTLHVHCAERLPWVHLSDGLKQK